MGGTRISTCRLSLCTTSCSFPRDFSISLPASLSDRFSVTVPLIWRKEREEMFITVLQKTMLQYEPCAGFKQYCCGERDFQNLWEEIFLFSNLFKKCFFKYSGAGHIFQMWLLTKQLIMFFFNHLHFTAVLCGNLMFFCFYFITDDTVRK